MSCRCNSTMTVWTVCAHTEITETKCSAREVSVSKPKSPRSPGSLSSAWSSRSSLSSGSPSPPRSPSSPKKPSSPKSPRAHNVVGTTQRGWFGFSKAPKPVECTVKKSHRVQWGFCPMCIAYYDKIKMDVQVEAVVLNYWRYKARHEFIDPVHPSLIPGSALLTTQEVSAEGAVVAGLEGQGAYPIECLTLMNVILRFNAGESSEQLMPYLVSMRESTLLVMAGLSATSPRSKRRFFNAPSLPPSPTDGEYPRPMSVAEALTVKPGHIRIAKPPTPKDFIRPNSRLWRAPTPVPPVLDEEEEDLAYCADVCMGASFGEITIALENAMDHYERHAKPRAKKISAMYYPPAPTAMTHIPEESGVPESAPATRTCFSPRPSMESETPKSAPPFGNVRFAKCSKHEFISRDDCRDCKRNSLDERRRPIMYKEEAPAARPASGPFLSPDVYKAAAEGRCACEGSVRCEGCSARSSMSENFF